VPGKTGIVDQGQSFRGGSCAVDPRPSPVKGFLIDIDGVLHSGGRVIPGAPEALEAIDRTGCRIRFVSNSTRKGRRTIAGQLEALGFRIPSDHIFTPPLAAVSLMKSEGKTGCRLLTTDEIVAEFEEAGIDVLSPEPDYIVIGDAGDRFTYGSMNEAFRLIIGGAGILALEKDRYWMGADGLMLSAGPFVTALEYATGTTARILGKPSPAFFGLALTDMELGAPEVAMIGDDIRTDIGGASACGLRTILVRTGKYRPGQPGADDPLPDLVLGSIADLPAVLGVRNAP
jgi:HAD superfamily hydrolase (TIGR01458 family)